MVRMHIPGIAGLLLSGLSAIATIALADDKAARTFDVSQASQQTAQNEAKQEGAPSIQLGVRPFYLVAGMEDGRLKRKLESCASGPFYKTDFSIGHRGAALQFPEHTRESYEAAARMGAGIVECDVTFTADGELVCRHAECDLHTTTNIVATELNNKCSVPWSQGTAPRCCASDITLEEFRSLTGKMDASDPSATDAEGYLGGTADWRTDLYTGRGNLLTFSESIRLNQQLGVKHTPELKGGDPARIASVFGGQEAYAQKLADELADAGVRPRDAWPQSFDLNDVLYWIDNTPYGKQAVYLVDFDPSAGSTIPPLPGDELVRLKKLGVRIIAPPIPALLAVDENDRIVPSPLARELRQMGFKIITWSFERSDVRRGAAEAGYYFSFDPEGRAVEKDSDMYEALDVLARRVRIEGIFSDWPATVTYYANCMKL